MEVCMTDLDKEINLQAKEIIKKIADDYKDKLEIKICGRINEMKNDDKSHYLIYRVLGISNAEGELIDSYQNKGRFLYNYAGNFLEKAAIKCIELKYKDAKSNIRIENKFGEKPKTFEIDCLVGKYAHEIKWRDSTTDGDHIIKENNRVEIIHDKGYIPVRVMFYKPNRYQAIDVQRALESVYIRWSGQYYSGDAAWDYIKSYTGIDLLKILKEIAEDRFEEKDACDEDLAKTLISNNKEGYQND